MGMKALNREWDKYRREDIITIRMLKRNHTINYLRKTIICLSLCINVHSLNEIFLSGLTTLPP